MEFIGRINRRKLYYVQVRGNSEWKSSLPNCDWIVFTIANEEDEELIPSAVKACMDKSVSYTCSAGTIANRTENYFDEEIAWRGVDYEIKTKKEIDYEESPMTTAHESFDEGFWFASTLASHHSFYIDKIVCLDFTKRNVKKNLVELIDKINNGWLPSYE